MFYTLNRWKCRGYQQLSAIKKKGVASRIFGSGENSIGISYLRFSIVPQINSSVFSYNDLGAWTNWYYFVSISLVKKSSVGWYAKRKEPTINPKIKIIAPLGLLLFGWKPMEVRFLKLKPEYYGVYAQYFVKYIQAMKKWRNYCRCHYHSERTFTRRNKQVW